MTKNFSDLNFILLVGALFGVLTIVHALSRIQRKMATKKLPVSKPSSKELQPSFIRPGINWIKVVDLETEEEVVN